MELLSNIKSKVKLQKNGKPKKKKSTQCIAMCVGEIFFYPQLKKKSDASYTKVINGLAKALTAHNPENIEQAIEIIMNKDVKAIQAVKKLPRKFTIPKKGDAITSLVPIFTALSISGVLRDGSDGILKAIKITLDVKKDLEDGKEWSGDIEISENLVLRLNKSRLILYLK